MRTRLRHGGFAAAAWALGLVVACSSNNGGGASAPGAVAPAIQSVTPIQLFRGRATAIAIGGVNTSFSDASQVSIGGGNIAVEDVHAISTAGLRAAAVVPVDFPDAKADITVDGLSAVGVFDIADAVKAEKPVQVNPGESGLLALLNLDLAHSFDASLALDAGKDILVAATDGSADEVTVQVTPSPSAKPGPHDLKIGLAGASALVKGAIVVNDAPIPSFMPKVDNTLTVAKGKDRAVLQVPGVAGKLFDVRVMPGAMNITPKTGLALIDPALGFSAPLATAFSGEILAAPSAPDLALLYVVLFGAPFDADQDVVVHGDLVAPALSKESDPHADFMTANAVTAPALVSAALDKKAEVDVYAVTVTAGTLVVRTLPDDSVMQKFPTDTQVAIFDASKKLLASNDDEQPNSSYSFVTATVTAGTAYVQVSSGANAFTDGGAYKLALLVR